MRRTRHLQRLREAASILMCRTAVAALAAALTTGTVVAHADSESYMTCMAMTLGTTTSRSVGPSIRTSTRTVLLPHISVPDGFDNPLPESGAVKSFWILSATLTSFWIYSVDQHRLVESQGFAPAVKVGIRCLPAPSTRWSRTRTGSQIALTSSRRCLLQLTMSMCSIQRS